MKELVFNFYSIDKIPYERVSEFGTSCLIQLQFECLTQGFNEINIESLNNHFSKVDDCYLLTVTVKYKFSNKDNTNE